MPADVTQLPNQIESGDPSAAEELLPLVYGELRRLAAHKMSNERPGQTLQPTALVHEAWMRLGADQQPHWQNRAHFFGAAAEAIRRILIDRARKRQVREASGLASPEVFDESRIELKAPVDEILAINEVLDRFEQVDSDATRLVKLRYFVGMNMDQTAEALGLSRRSTERLWTFARAWLRDAIKADS
jgi:RNA polymerase sigma factor (TIGR02999 family)